MTPTDILAASMAAKSFIHVQAYIQAMVGLESGLKHAAASQDVTRWMLYQMSFAASA